MKVTYIVPAILLAFTLMLSSIPHAMAFFPENPEASKYAAAAVAFGLSTLSAGYAIGKAGSAGLAGTAERPEIRTTAIIITALGEAIAIYGLVIVVLILSS